jgi:uncharacterized protein (TIGR03790 family)
VIGRFSSLLACSAVAVCATTAPARAQTAANVLVVSNDTVPVSGRIAAYYAQKRSIPAEQVLKIKTVSTDEISRDRFMDEIERPIAGWLAAHAAHDRILYIVLAKGVPLRIQGTDGPQGTVASVDSELALLYRLLAGTAAPAAGFVPNPYFLGAGSLSGALPFSHRDADIFLVTRLDGFTEEDVLHLIDRGIAPAHDGSILLDAKSESTDRGGDAWLKSAADALVAAGQRERVIFDSTPEALTKKSSALGYYSWGSNDPAITSRDLQIGFAPGALAATYVSTDARTFKAPPESWTTGKWENRAGYFEGSPQSLTGDLIRAGVTGVAGNVAEPYLAGAVRPQILFPAYLNGFNLVESFYLALPYLSWQTVVIGDPLCAPFKQKTLAAEIAAPPLDSETELPKFFSDRRLGVLASIGIRPQAGKISLRAEALMARGDKAAALKALEAATALDARLIVDQFTLANRYAEGGDFDRSIDRYRSILATAPDEMRSNNNLAYTLAVNKNSPEEGLPLAEKAYKLSKARPAASLAEVLGNASIADTLGWIHFLLGNMSEAETFLGEAARGAPNNPQIHLHLAELQLKAGRIDEANSELKRALSLDPTYAKREDVIKLRAKLPSADQ